MKRNTEHDFTHGKNIDILVGDCIESMRSLPDQSVHTCVTSPPYWGLRDYGKDEQIGLEQTPEAFVEALLNVFREVKRVLRDDGTLWLNLGDSYASGKARYSTKEQTIAGGGRNDAKLGDLQNGKRACVKHHEYLKDKDLVGIPWLVAFALQRDGWYLRQDIIWAKPNCMPESMKDRCTKSHEYIFMLTKSPTYFFDQEAIKEPIKGVSARRMMRGVSDLHKNTNGAPGQTPHSMATGRENRTNTEPPNYLAKKIKRSVWWVSPKPYKGAHFAVFPPELIEPCILAGTSAKGCCSKCLAPHTRKTGRQCSECPCIIPTQAKECPDCGYRNTGWLDERTTNADKRAGEDNTVGSLTARKKVMKSATVASTTFFPTCECDADVIPCTALDPFGGSGTTAGVALRHGRKAIMCELNPEYAAVMPKRIEAISGLAATQKTLMEW